MPWIKNEQGDEIYLVSEFSKDELPTWFELHEEFYKQKWFTFDMINKDDLIIDRYYGIPHKYIVMKFVTNQLNKMLTEDGMMEPALTFINEYEYKFNTKIKNIEIIFDEKSDERYKTIIFVLTGENGNKYKLYPDDELYIKLIEIIIRDVIDYFKEPIGFKDKDGFLLEGYNDPKNRPKEPDMAL